MRFKKSLVKNAFFPLIHRETMKRLYFYEKSQWWNPTKLRELQEKKIRKMIRYAYNNVPYYRKIFKDINLQPEDIQKREDLAKIPVLTHQDVRQNLDDLTSAEKPKSSLFRCQTTGTTGHPLILYKDKSELGSSKACLYRGWKWCGYQIGEKKALIWGRRLKTSKYASLKKNLKQYLLRSLFIGAWDLSEEKIEFSIKRLLAANPTFLSGYVSAIYLYADFVNRRGSNIKFNLKGVSTTAEPLLGFQRREIAKAFQCDVFDQYGCGEVNSLGFECEEHMGLHVPIERVHIEFLGLKDDSPASEGERGRVVVTCLENYGMPFIRYDTEDLGIKREEFCTCGRKLPLMDQITGRTLDLIKLPNGKVIYPGFFMYVLEELEWIAKYGIIQFQLVQEKLNHIVLKIQSQKQPSQQTLKSFEHFVKKQLEDVAFDIQFVDRIPVSASGKRKYMISEVNPQSS